MSRQKTNVRVLYVTLFLVCAVHLHVVLAGIVQVQVLHRHGARQHLDKSVDNPSSETGGAMLLRKGLEQTRGLGKAIRERYYSPQGASRDSAIAGVSAEYTGSADIRAISSDLDRTMASSRGFLSGLYPDGESDRIPTHVPGAIDRDWVLRSYTLCPKFQKSVSDFLDSDSYKSQADKVKDAGLLRRVATSVDEDPELANAFNVYDKVVLERGGYEDADVDVPVISDEEFDAVKDAADWIESSKYASNDVASNWVSGPVLSEMVRQSEAMRSDSAAKHRLVEYSGHYPLMLGIFAALRMSGIRAESVSDITNTIPGFAAAFIWELHSDGNVRFRWSNGDGNYTFISIPCGEDSKATECSLSSIKSRLEKDKLLKDASTFCSSCGENSNNSVLCNGDSAAKASSTSVSSRPKVAAGIGGTVLGLLVGALVGFFIARRTQTNEKEFMRGSEISAIVDQSNTDCSVAQGDSPFDQQNGRYIGNP